MTIARIDPHTDPRWIDFISTHHDATIFHHPSWLHVIESTYGYRSICLGAVCEGRLVGILPLLVVRSWLTGRRAVCLPFSDACVPLGEDAETTRMLISSCCDLRSEHGWKYIEVRGGAEHPAMEPSLRFKIHTKPLQADSDKVFLSFNKRQVRQHITKSIRDGVTVERSQDNSAMMDFIRLNALTRRRLGVPPQPDVWFLNIMEALISKGLGFVSIASLDGRCIAASVFLCFKGSMYYKYSASDERFLGHRPNNLIAWDAMRWGCEHGYSLFDFGRTDLNSEGLLRYKRGWGTVESDLVYYRISEKKASPLATTDNLRQVKTILQTTPVPMLKMIGKLLYEHAG